MEIEEIKELLKNKKFNELKHKLSEMKSADISAILDELDKESVINILNEAASGLDADRIEFEDFMNNLSILTHEICTLP